MKNQSKLKLSIIALILTVVPYILMPLFLYLMWSTSITLLLSSLSMLGGFVLGMILLTRDRQQIGKVGTALSIIAILLAASPVILIIVFFIGASLGLVSLM